MPKPKAKYRKTANPYKTSYFLRCYFDDVANLERVVKILDGENLWQVTVSDEDKRLTTDCIIEDARSLFSCN